MYWIIYVILGFLYWKFFPHFSWLVLLTVLVAIIWYVCNDTTHGEDDWPDGS